MNAHTVTVEFDDAAAKVEDVMKALGEAGFSTTKQEKLP